MARTAEYIRFDGLFEKDVLGTFRIIRGFADLRDLAEVSVPYNMSDGEMLVHGYQRSIDNDHAIRIKQYLESANHRFLPEVILSVRVDLDNEIDTTQNILGVLSRAGSEALADGVSIKRKWKSNNIRVHTLQVKIKELNKIKEKRYIRRIDGNHRLALADKLIDDAGVPNKYLAPFCLILLGPVDNRADDYSESLIFHILNSTALPLESEHALKLILGQDPQFDMSPAQEFSYSPELHFTRLLRDGLHRLPLATQRRLGIRPLSCLRNAAKSIIEVKPDAVNSITNLISFSDTLLDAITTITNKVGRNHPDICQVEYFIELTARVWISFDLENQENRINESVKYLERMAVWMVQDGLHDLHEASSLSKQLIDTFNLISNRRPKSVFLARWYPKATDGNELTKANLRLEMIKRTLSEIKSESNISLNLIDMGTEEGGTYLIHNRMYEAIETSDIILIDLSGARPNVCIEAGFALNHHEKDKLIFLFQETEHCKTVPFDLSPFRYEPITDTGEIPNKIKPHIVSIVNN